MQVKTILDTKGHEFWSVSPNASVYEAIQTMAEKGVGSVLVIENGKVQGIVTERDYARKVVLEGKSSPDIPVTEIMTAQVLCTHPEQTIEEAMALMTEKRVRHLPVVTNGQITGVVSIGDLVKAVISEQQFLIQQLENYITS
ncbi:MAG TPA: CBS domain-containing protein [Gammaproteobacteria bacterium]|nr:CBS domain-containing protein [Gammaproteobacteria bacterium]MCP5429037.1 CBS domain-containing protein [Chromatiaceae bacterium]MCP5436253.1 CBS domain-containing protein [Chromatiaceae bacterium]HOP14973.1 CBS domain-containing protein [Gammaproteobacteria bacterium]HPQ23772.1 CBS domain-containing protein [Gammaproteobacteria bacterium]